MTDQEKYDVVMAQIRDEFPDFSIVRKADSRLMRFLAVLHFLATFGSKKFMDTFTTVLGETVYVPAAWEDPSRKSVAEKIVTLRHERVHMRQRRRYGGFVYALMYMGPFPVLFAWGRAELEKEAYEETLRATAELRGAQFALKMREHIIGHFTGAEYLWMWVLRSQIERWFDAAYQKVLESHLKD